MLFQHRTLDLPIPDAPYLRLRVPPAFGSPCDLLQFLFHISDADRDKVVLTELRQGRLPVLFLDDQFHGLDAFPARRIVPVAHADQRIAMLGLQALGPLLAGFQFQPGDHAEPRLLLLRG